jgi:spore maturation protein CgeB
LSYLGTYADDRQAMLTTLLLDAARQRTGSRFLIGGAMYPSSFTWMPNISYIEHVPPQDHAAFYGSASWTLNVTREPMAAMGWSPSGRLFEAAACGAPLITDWWEGLDAFFEPGLEIVVARDTRDVLAALDLDEAERQRIASAGRQRALDCHTAMHRARDLEAVLASSVATSCGPSADASVA